VTQRVNCSVTQHTDVTYGCPPAFRACMSSFAISMGAIFSTLVSAQKRLGRGVFTLEVVAPRDSSPRSGSVTRQPRRATERAHPQCVPVAGRIEALPQVEGLSNSG
jgi:hypothetical protein